MRDRRFSVFLVLLIISTPFNQGQKIKANDRRASGLVPYPRIGRNSELTNFPRTDRAAGFVHYPRVGRSDQPVSNINFNRYHDMESDGEFQIYNSHDMDLDSAPDQDYEGKPISLKHIDKIIKDGVWLIPDYVHGAKEYRPTQRTEESKSLYSNVRGPRINQDQLMVNGYTPRIGREAEHDVLMSLL